MVRRTISQSGKRVAIILPAFNEAQVIGQVLDDLIKHPKSRGCHIIVVNDGSSDDTSKVAASKKTVMTINHAINMGAGAATRTGLTAARKLGCHYAITIDADGQHKIEDSFKVLADAKKMGADLVIGSRLKDRAGMPRIKTFGNKLLNVMSYLIVGVMVSDSQSGLRVFSRDCLEKLSYHSNGYAFCSEMIWRAKQQGLTVAESPIGAVYTDYSKGKGQKNVAGFFAIIGSLTKHRLAGLLNE